MNVNTMKITDDQISALEGILSSFLGLPVLEESFYNHPGTLLVHVDVINGFLKEGALASPRVEQILPSLIRLNQLLPEVTRAFILDVHEENSTEFQAYPPHCLKGSAEAELVDELKPFTEEAVFIEKNSTNAFHVKAYQDLLMKDFSRIVFVGDVTDICLLQVVLSTITFYQQHNRMTEVAVVIDAVDTFDLPVTHHDPTLLNLMSLYLMRQNGVKLLKLS